MNKSRNRYAYNKEKRSGRSSVRIDSVIKESRRVEMGLSVGERQFQVFFESENYPLEPIRDAGLPLCLHPAMAAGNELVFNGVVDATLHSHLPRVQELICQKYRGFSQVQITQVTPITISREEPNRVGLFFSGGLDSWYSLLKHMDEITDLVFLHGADIRLDDQLLYERSVALAKRVADHYHKNLIIVRTNIRSFTDRFVQWNLYCSSLMQSIPYLMQNDFKKMIYASSFVNPDKIAQQAELDMVQSWSTSTLDVIYDGVGLSRLDKASVVGQEEMALQNLRVCWENLNSELNCSKCEKCLRTMVNLHAVGALNRSTTFATPLDPKAISSLYIRDVLGIRFAEENLAAVSLLPGNEALIRALRKTIRFSRLKNWVREHMPWIYSIYFLFRRMIK